MRLRRSLKALSVERDELRAFKEGAEKSVKQRERRWVLEKSALSARLLEMESGFAEQVRELRRDAMGGAALRKTAEQLTERLAAAEAEAAAARLGHAERLGACEEHLQLALQAGQRHAAGMAEARAAEQAWRARQEAEQAQRETLQAELAAFSADAEATAEEVRGMAELHGRQLNAAQARVHVHMHTPALAHAHAHAHANALALAHAHTHAHVHAHAARRTAHSVTWLSPLQARELELEIALQLALSSARQP